MIHSLIFYGSFIVFPFFALLVWLKWKKKLPNWIFVPMLIGALVLTYARFIERYLIFVHEQNFEITDHAESDPATIKIAIFSDPHIGLYKGAWFLERTVEKVNALEPDLVLIAGDFIYKIKKEDLAASQMALANLNAPTYGVLGNHDQESINFHTSGEFSQEEMYEVLSPHIKMIDNQIIEVEIKGKKMALAGIGSLWADNADTNILENIDPEKITIGLMHNPDTAYGFPNYNIDLAIAGHTHGGQIRVPFLYHKVIPTKHPFDEGWYEIQGMPLFITTGTGEVGIPMRLLIPPRIDVINLVID